MNATTTDYNSGQRDFGDSHNATYSSPPQQHSGYGSQYGQGPGGQPNSSAPPQHQQYGSSEYSSPPPQQGYAGGAPQAPDYRPPQDKPPIPSGWTPRWDSQHQQWYYVEDATGRSQWEAPGYDASRPPADTRGHDSYGGSAPPPSGHGQHESSHGGGYNGGGGGYGGQGNYGRDGGGFYEQEKKDKGSNKNGMLLGAAGGLAVGAVGGALLANALGMTIDGPSSNKPPSCSNRYQMTPTTRTVWFMSNNLLTRLLSMPPRFLRVMKATVSLSRRPAKTTTRHLRMPPRVVPAAVSARSSKRLERSTKKSTRSTMGTTRTRLDVAELANQAITYMWIRQIVKHVPRTGRP